MSMTAPLEALLFAAGSNGLTTEELANLLQLTVDETRAVCTELGQTYQDRGAGIELVELAGHWQIVTRAEFSDYLRKMASSPTSSTLSTAALEVLAIVAYRQPVSRADIEFVRGVQSDRVMSTLVHRQLIHEVGRRDGPGRPILYGTTETFLQLFGLRSLDDLPPTPEQPEGTKEFDLFHLTPSLPRD